MTLTSRTDFDTYYRDEEILDVLAEQCRHREIALRRGRNSWRRPLKADTGDELRDLIEGFPGSGTLSVYGSAELYEDPLRLCEEEPADLRYGWDYILDLDGEPPDRIGNARRCLVAVLEVLETFGITGYKIRFSGSKGFHLTLPGEALRVFKSHREFVVAYPTVPKVVTLFLKAAVKPEDRKGVSLDMSVYQRRHVFRLAYSLHNKTGLASIPLYPDEISSFKPDDATVGNFDVDWDLLEARPGFREAEKLVQNAGKWWRKRRDKGSFRRTVKRGIYEFQPGARWIEKLLQTPVADGRTRLVWLVLAPYLVNYRDLSVEEASKILVEYLKRCDEVSSLGYDLEDTAYYHCNRASRGGLKPLSWETLTTTKKYMDLAKIVEEALGKTADSQDAGLQQQDPSEHDRGKVETLVTAEAGGSENDEKPAVSGGWIHESPHDLPRWQPGDPCPWEGCDEVLESEEDLDEHMEEEHL